ncbi:hypothetical protein CACET_c16010 [Clostridium aceticum]|uniref:Uncharacterized protein n=1 Tax=Clostridium aceticum TaxID=84022 RepID=A0A0D8ICB1_9CLOT|nr:hypothetical protein [Clostridium aceticum]AKL95050.1 hypothetical protein CACET_c16010 [Clostridium aceticum]KJF27940.1 hypothetical protein TZ02_05055 [Clostridium aceticum]
MRKNTMFKLFLLLIIPYLSGEIINRLINYGIALNSSILLSFSSVLLILLPFVSTAFWFWVGKQFGSLKMHRTKSFILGNSIWSILLGLHIWQFTFVQDINRNISISSISQHYVLGFVSWSTKAISLFTNTIQGTMVIRVAYLMMLIVFIIGFSNSSPTVQVGAKKLTK